MFWYIEFSRGNCEIYVKGPYVAVHVERDKIRAFPIEDGNLRTVAILEGTQQLWNTGDGELWDSFRFEPSEEPVRYSVEFDLRYKVEVELKPGDTIREAAIKQEFGDGYRAAAYGNNLIIKECKKID